MIENLIVDGIAKCYCNNCKTGYWATVNYYEKNKTCPYCKSQNTQIGWGDNERM